MSGHAKRLIAIALGTAILCALLALYVFAYLTNVPGSASAAQTPAGAQLYLGTVPASKGTDAHPSWVSYYSVNASSGDWRHVTTFNLPAHTVVHVTIYNYDGQSGLRNPFIARTQGTLSGNFMLDGKPTQQIGPDTASHIFAIPQMGVSVPVYGVPDDAKNQCANAPCALSTAHSTTSFTFRTPGRGLYRWQCFVPCAAGFIDGWGGPMQTVGYMDGFIKVV
ncbi:MAG TPA: hypothetical protein VGH45_04300 [Solirubrobacteraceae bacterium]|jgi:hypothetical protein